MTLNEWTNRDLVGGFCLSCTPTVMISLDKAEKPHLLRFSCSCEWSLVVRTSVERPAKHQQSAFDSSKNSPATNWSERNHKTCCWNYTTTLLHNTIIHSTAMTKPHDGNSRKYNWSGGIAWKKGLRALNTIDAAVTQLGWSQREETQIHSRMGRGRILDRTIIGQSHTAEVGRE